MNQDDRARLSAIRQIAVTVRAVGAALAFYRDVLGAFLFSPSPTLAFPAAGDVRIMLTTPRGAGAPGLNTLLYFSTGDIEATYAAVVTRRTGPERSPSLAASLPDHELWIAFVRYTESNLAGLMEERRI